MQYYIIHHSHQCGERYCMTVEECMTDTDAMPIEDLKVTEDMFLNGLTDTDAMGT